MQIRLPLCVGTGINESHFMNYNTLNMENLWDANWDANWGNTWVSLACGTFITICICIWNRILQKKYLTSWLRGGWLPHLKNVIFIWNQKAQIEKLVRFHWVFVKNPKDYLEFQILFSFPLSPKLILLKRFLI